MVSFNSFSSTVDIYSQITIRSNNIVILGAFTNQGYILINQGTDTGYQYYFRCLGPLSEIRFEKVKSGTVVSGYYFYLNIN